MDDNRTDKFTTKHVLLLPPTFKRPKELSFFSLRSDTVFQPTDPSFSIPTFAQHLDYRSSQWLRIPWKMQDHQFSLHLVREVPKSVDIFYKDLLSLSSRMSWNYVTNDGILLQERTSAKGPCKRE